MPMFHMEGLIKMIASSDKAYLNPILKRTKLKCSPILRNAASFIFTGFIYLIEIFIKSYIRSQLFGNLFCIYWIMWAFKYTT